MQQRIIVAIAFGASAALASLQVNGPPTTREGWIGVLLAAVVAAWGKYSSSSTVIAADREVWSPERRLIETGRR